MEAVRQGVTYPKLKINVYAPEASYTSSKYLRFALKIQYHGRRNKAFVQRLSHDAGVQQVLTDMMESAPARRLAPFVKVFPWDLNFDEEAFREMCRWEDDFYIMISAMPSFNWQYLVAVAKEWTANGF